MQVRVIDPARIQEIDCEFYHTMTFPDGTAVLGDWDFRESLSDYIGNIDVYGKTVLDVGTASGLIAFEMERRGAKVTAYEMDSGASAPRIPFKDALFYNDHAAWLRQFDAHLERLTNGFWYAHHRFQSAVRVIYGRLNDLPEMTPPVDIVIAGAIVEHTSDPISTIGVLSKLAKDKLVLASTPIVESDDLLMVPVTTLDDPRYDYTWFAPSTGLLRRILENVGFRILRIGSSRQYFRIHDAWVERPTIVSERHRS